jgi:hypothetical protein
LLSKLKNLHLLLELELVGLNLLLQVWKIVHLFCEFELTGLNSLFQVLKFVCLFRIWIKIYNFCKNSAILSDWCSEMRKSRRSLNGGSKNKRGSLSSSWPIMGPSDISQWLMIIGEPQNDRRTSRWTWFKKFRTPIKMGLCKHVRNEFEKDRLDKFEYRLLEIIDKNVKGFLF